MKDDSHDIAIYMQSDTRKKYKGTCTQRTSTWFLILMTSNHYQEWICDRHAHTHFQYLWHHKHVSVTDTKSLANINDLKPQDTTKRQRGDTDVKQINKRNTSKHRQFSYASDQPAPDWNQILKLSTWSFHWASKNSHHKNNYAI